MSAISFNWAFVTVPTLFLVGLTRSLGDLRRLLEQHGGRRRLQFEGE